MTSRWREQSAIRTAKTFLRILRAIFHINDQVSLCNIICVIGQIENDFSNYTRSRYFFAYCCGERRTMTSCGKTWWPRISQKALVIETFSLSQLAIALWTHLELQYFCTKFHLVSHHITFLHRTLNVSEWNFLSGGKRQEKSELIPW